LDQDITIANPGWLVIGRQVDTGFGPRADLLAIDAVGNLVLMELVPVHVAGPVLTGCRWSEEGEPGKGDKCGA
jgi:hypothetical protein